VKRKIGASNLIKVLDSTLREGEQTPGVYFDRHIKLAIAQMLDAIGIDIIETGHPTVTEDIRSAVHNIAHSKLNAIVAAHSRSVKSDIDTALECGVAFIGIFYCVSDERLSTVFKKDLDAAIAQITDVIRYAKEKNPKLLIRYTPEDTVRSQFENVTKVAVAAVKAGADIISIADTTGYMIPGSDHNMYDYVKNLKAELHKENVDPMIAVHCHNDRGLALANALDGIRGGANIVDASVLGLGERAGIVDLAQLLTLLTADYKYHKWNLSLLPELYNLVSKHSNSAIPLNFPIIGENAFTHCAGVHTHAAAINPMHYESLNPQIVGRQRKFALDHMSGMASLNYALKLIDQNDLDDELKKDILQEIKTIGQKGRLIELSEIPHIIEVCKHHKHYKQLAN